MITAGEVKMTLDRAVMATGVTLLGVHSVLLEDGQVHVAFDTDKEEPFNFAFELPQAVAETDLHLFARWLAAPDRGGATLH
jgi:hypothetical protein